MALFSKDKKNILLVDIGSSSVGACIVSFNNNKDQSTPNPKILSSKRTYIKIQENLNFDRFFSLIISALSLSVYSVLSPERNKFSKVHCFLASPWYASEIRVISLKKDKEFVFSKAFFDSLVIKESKNIKNEDLENRDIDIRVIDSKAIDIKLNGYRTENPFGKKTKDVDISLFLGMSSEQVLNLITKEIERDIPEVPIVFHTFLLPFFIFVRNSFPEIENGILIDIGGEVTDVSFMNNHILTRVSSFPLGKNFVLRKVSTLLKKEIEETRSLMKLLTEGKLDALEKKKLLEALLPARAEWLKSFRETFGDGEKTNIHHNKKFLTADNEIIRWFSESILNEEYGQYTLSSDKFSIIQIGIPFLSKEISFGGTIERDQFLAIEALFLSETLN